MVASPPDYSYPPAPGGKPKKSLVPWIVGGVLGLIVLVLVIVLIAVAANNGDDAKPVPPVVPTTVVPTVPPTTVAPTTEPTTETPSTPPATLNTPSFVRTDSLYTNAFVQVMRQDSNWGPALTNISDAKVLQLGVATCVILNSNDGDGVKTAQDVAEASNGKVTPVNAGFLVGASHAALCPTVSLTIPSAGS